MPETCHQICLKFELFFALQIKFKWVAEVEVNARREKAREGMAVKVAARVVGKVTVKGLSRVNRVKVSVLSNSHKVSIKASVKHNSLRVKGSALLSNSNKASGKHSSLKGNSIRASTLLSSLKVNVPSNFLRALGKLHLVRDLDMELRPLRIHLWLNQQLHFKGLGLAHRVQPLDHQEVLEIYLHIGYDFSNYHSARLKLISYFLPFISF